MERQKFRFCVKMGECVKNVMEETFIRASVVRSTAIRFLQYNYKLHSKHTVQDLNSILYR